VVLVSNHSGQLPFDAAMIEVGLLMDKDPPRAVRALVEKWVPTLPFVSTFMARCGQIVGTPENCRGCSPPTRRSWSSRRGEGPQQALPRAVPPEEVRGGLPPARPRVERPVVPVGVVGAEEQAPQLFDLKPLAGCSASRPSHHPHPAPFPLPSRYHIHFGEPIRFAGSADDEDAELEERVTEVQRAVQGLLERGVAERGSVYW